MMSVMLQGPTGVKRNDDLSSLQEVQEDFAEEVVSQVTCKNGIVFQQKNNSMCKYLLICSGNGRC